MSDQTIALYQTSIQHNGVEGSSARQQAIDKAIRDVLLASEAARRGIVVSDAAVDAFIADQRQKNQAAPAENRAMFQATLDGLGVTEQQYWSDPRMRSMVRSILVNARLIAQLTPAGGSPREGAAQLETVLTELKTRAVIRYAQ